MTHGGNTEQGERCPEHPHTRPDCLTCVRIDRQAWKARAAEAEAERDFLLARLTPRDGSDWVGISSNEMVRVAILGERIDGFNVPHDEADLRRCEQTYLRAPDHLKPALLPVLKGFRILVAEHDERPGSYTWDDATKWAEDALARTATAEAA